MLNIILLFVHHLMFYKVYIIEDNFYLNQIKFELDNAKQILKSL